MNSNDNRDNGLIALAEPAAQACAYGGWLF